MKIDTVVSQDEILPVFEEYCEFSATVCSYLPAIRDLADSLVTIRENKQRQVDLVNARAGKTIVAMSTNPASKTFMAVSRYSRNLGFSIDDINEYVDIVVDAKITSMKAAKGTIFTTDYVTGEMIQFLKDDTRLDAELFYLQRNAIDRAQAEYGALNQVEKNEVTKLLFTEPEDEDIQATDTLTSLMLALSAPPPDGSQPPLDTLLNQLRLNQLDFLIYEHAVTVEKYSRKREALLAMTKLVMNVSTSLQPNIGTDEVIKALGCHTASFSNGSTQEMHSLRQGLYLRLSACLSEIRTMNMVPSKKQDVEVLKAQIALATENVIYELNRRGLTRLEVTKVAKRKNANESKIDQLDQAGSLEILKPVFRPRQVCMASKGESSFVTPLEGQDELEKQKLTYANRFVGATKLPENLNSAIAYIASANFSAGRVKGIKPYGSSVSLDGQPSRIYSLKPQDAVGVKINSNSMRNTRLILALNANGDAVILGFVKRDELRRFEESVGIGRTRRK